MPSLLRLVGLAVGVLLLLAAVRGARGRASRGSVILELAGGLGLLVVSAFPDLVVPLADFLGFRDEPFSRLVTVLIVATAGLFALVLVAIGKADRAHQRVGRLIRALSAAQVEHDQARGRLGGVLVAIPAYNEAENLPAVLREIPATCAGLPTHALVIDDGSRDGTRQVAVSHGAHVVTHVVNSGQGAALQTGYLVAERLGVDVVVTLDADGQHDPAEMERLVGPIVRGEADFVVGSRRKGAYERGSLARHVGISVFSHLVNLLGRTAVTDVANGYRAIGAARLTEFVFTEEQFHNPELLMGAARAGLRVLEVPVTIRRRAGGQSKKGTAFRYGFGFLRVILKTWLR